MRPAPRTSRTRSWQIALNWQPLTEAEKDALAEAAPPDAADLRTGLAPALTAVAYHGTGPELDEVTATTVMVNSTGSSGETGSGKAVGTRLGSGATGGIDARKATWTDQSTAYQLALAPQLARGPVEDLAHAHLDVDLTGMVPYY